MTQHQNGWNSFINLCLTAKTPDALSKLLNLLLTAEETADIATRCLIVKELLLQNKTQRDMAKDLKVSIAKITRGSNELKRQDTKLLNYLKKHLT
jgi:TrpR family trp operon transcriptional repressor